MSTILVTGHFDLDPAKRDTFIAAAITCQEATRQEEGCVSYSFSADLSDPGRFHISEEWASQEATDRHGASEHFLTFMSSMGDFGVTSAAIQKWVGATSSPLF